MGSDDRVRSRSIPDEWMSIYEAVFEIRTSCQSHRGTEPGSALPFSQAEVLVRSRHLASTARPFFSLLTWTKKFQDIHLAAGKSITHTEGCKHRFLRLVSPKPVKLSSFSRSASVSACSIRYAIRRLSSVSAFSISGTVREQ